MRTNNYDCIYNGIDTRTLHAFLRQGGSSTEEIIVKKKIFSLPSLGKNKLQPAGSNINTVPLSNQQMDATLVNDQHVVPPQLMYGCGQSVGRQRDHNEDSIFAFSMAFGEDPNHTPLGLFIVADGMGGHQYGEVASSTAVRTLAGFILKHFQESLANSSQSKDESFQDLMAAAVIEAQRTVKQAAPGSGTTLTVALVAGQKVTIGHIGDSRAYIIHPGGGGEVLTRDHSIVKRMEELGQITSEEAAIHPQRNVLYQALGQSEILEPDIFTVDFPQADRLLLCSDGLWGVLSADNLFRAVASTSDLQNICQGLVASANEAGGPDNISVIVVKHSY